MAEYRRRISGLNSEQVMHAMGIDDAYRVERVFSRSSNGVTELVTIEGAGPFIRKKMPTSEANRSVWAALAGSNCSRLPQVAATYEMPDWFVAVYDYISGETLEDVIARANYLESEDAVQIAQDVCEALAALHACGVAHLDVSPKNVVLAADGAHLIDFGNAQHLTQDVGSKKRARPKGTWGFAAPEQFFSMSDERSDVFAVGRLLGYMLTGVYPNEEGMDAFDGALEDDSRVPQALRFVIDRATAFEPSMRQESVRRLGIELSCEIDGEGAGRSTGSHDENRSAQMIQRSTGDSLELTQGRGEVDAFCADRLEATAVKGGTSARNRWSATKVATLILVVAITCTALSVAYIMLTSKSPAFRGLNDVRTSELSSSNDDALSRGQDDAALSANDNDAGVSGATDMDLERAYDSLEIVESGWGVSANGYVGYALTLANSSDDLTIEYPEIVITGRDEHGSVLFSDTQVLNVVFPGSRLTYACQTGNGTPPAEIEFSVSRPKDYQVSRGKGSPTDFRISGLTEHAGEYGTTRFTGEVTTITAGDEFLGQDGIWLSIIMRDAEGNIVYGSNGHFTQPAVGESTTFEVEPYGCPEYDSVEAAAMAW